MFIPNEIRKCVVFLGRTKKNGPRWGATGFFYAVRLSDDDPRPYSYLVTARHVIDGIRDEIASGKTVDEKVLVRMNLKSGGSHTFESSIDDWQFHPTKEVDVAAMPFSEPWFDDMDHLTFTYEMIDEELVESEGIGPGQDVFVTGLFVNHIGKHRNIPIVRIGNIAAMPEERVAMRLDSRTRISADAYLIESRSIGGLSGSPVFVHVDEMMGGVLGAPARFYLLGLVYGHWDLNDPIGATEDMADEIRRYINMGIAIVVPATVIREVLYQPVFVEHRLGLAKSLGPPGK